MKLQYMSDLHIELMCKNTFTKLCSKIVPKCDVMILAGDIGNPFHDNYDIFLYKMSNMFEKVFIVAGNHEYYNNDIQETDDRVREICSRRNNLSFLHNTTEVYRDFRFIGTTQWTEIHDENYLTTDFCAIKNMNVKRYNDLHRQSLSFLGESIARSTAKNEKTIVITHHVPLHELTHEKYKIGAMAKYNQCFSADLSAVVEKAHTIESWFYGHTHTKTEKRLFNVPFYCNPLGYAGENCDTDINCTVDVSSPICQPI